METTPNQIDLWRQTPSEHQNLEFKEAKNSFDREKLNSYCVAIANEGGGHLVLGIADKPPRPVVSCHAFPNLVETADQLFRAVGFRVEIEEVIHPDGRVVVFHIPSRPRGTAYHLDGKYLMRSGHTLAPMSEDRLRAIFAEGGPDWLEEPTLTNLDAQGVVDLLDTQAFFELVRQPYPSDRAGVLDRLVRERLIDRTSSGFTIRRLGALLLAKRLDRFAELVRRAARVVVYTDTTKLKTRLDQVGHRGYAVGFAGLIDFVMAQLPQNEVFENALRKEVKLLPGEAMRELIHTAEIYQLPAPQFRAGHRRTEIIVHGPRPFDEMDRDDRLRACYQHCALRWVCSEQMTNQSLRARFGLAEDKAAITSQIIAGTIEAGLIKPDETAGASRKYARYIPFWA
jgi:predicted HTH transcriptional regulator